jgi:uncharacterized membrane protein
MRELAEFTKTTLIGGLLIVLPIYVSVLLLLKALSGVMALVSPVAAQLPTGTEFRQIIAVLIIIAVCFIAGLVVRTTPGLRVKSAFESYLLERIPGYTLFRGLAGRLAGREHTDAFAVALAEIEEALVPAFIVEKHQDGRYTVFVPSVPTPAAGAVYILPPERVHLVDVPFTRAVAVISKWGVGSEQLLAAMTRP